MTTTEGNVTRLRATVRGAVQGVGFRYWVHHTVERFGGRVTGQVHNLSDGAVEVEVESAERTLLDAILLDLHQGPTAAQVENVEAAWEDNASPRHHGAFRVS